MKDFKLNWKVVVLLGITMISVVLYKKVGDYQEFKAKKELEIYPKRLEGQQDPQKLKTLESSVEALKRELKSSQALVEKQRVEIVKYRELYSQALEQIERFKKMFSTYYICIQDTEGTRHYAYGPDNKITCNFWGENGWIKKETQTIKEYIEAELP